jgi:hypothetical protein
MPCSGGMQEIGGKGVAHVLRQFKAAIGLLAMMARVVHRAMPRSRLFLFWLTWVSKPLHNCPYQVCSAKEVFGVRCWF